MSIIEESVQKAKILNGALNKGNYKIEQIRDILREHDIEPGIDVYFGLILEELFKINRKIRPTGLVVEKEDEDGDPDYLIASFKNICVEP